MDGWGYGTWTIGRCPRCRRWNRFPLPMIEPGACTKCGHTFTPKHTLTIRPVDPNEPTQKRRRRRR